MQDTQRLHMQNRILLIVGILLILLGLGETVLRSQSSASRNTACSCRTTLISEPVAVVPAAFLQPTPGLSPTARPTETSSSTPASTDTPTPQPTNIITEIIGGVTDTPTPTPTPTRESLPPTTTPTKAQPATATRTPTRTPTRPPAPPTNTSILPTATQVPARPTDTAVPSTPTSLPTATATTALQPPTLAPIEVFTSTATPSATPTPTNSSTPTQTPTPTITPTATYTDDEIRSITATAEAIASATARALATNTPLRPTRTPTLEPTIPPTSTSTSTPTMTFTTVPTKTPTPTPTPEEVKPSPDTATPTPSPTFQAQIETSYACLILVNNPTPGELTAQPEKIEPRGGSALFAPPNRLSVVAQPATLPNVRISTDAPANMSENISLPITVTIEPADTEFASIQAALSEYGVTALSASVDGPEFALSPTEAQVTQWVNQQKLQWTWVASARKAGTQTLRISLTARGKPSWSTEAVEGPIWTGLVQVTVVSPDSGFNLGNLDLFAPLNTLAGLGLSFPWIYDQIKKRRAKKQSVQETAGEE